MPTEPSVAGPQALRAGRPGFFRGLALASVDLALGLLAIYLAFWVRLNVPLPWTLGLLPSDRLAAILGAWGFVLATQNLLLYLFGFYDLREPWGRLPLLRRLTAALGTQGLLMASFFFLTIQVFPRTVLVLSVPMNIGLLFLFRYAVERRLDYAPRRLAIVGFEDEVGSIAERIDRYHWHGYRVAGFVSPPRSLERISRPPSPELRAEGPSYPTLGDVADLPGLLRDGEIDTILVAHSEDTWRTGLIDELSDPENRAEVLLLPTPFDSLIGRTRFRSVHDVAMVEVVSEEEWKLSNPFKRAFDLVAALLLLVLSGPVLLLAMLCIRASSPGPIIFRQVRVGREGREFTLAKLRTMTENAEESTGAVLAARTDPRVTPVGRILRSLRIDELPQLLNVLRGDMSLVGPRPERPRFVEQFRASVPGYAARFAVRPGLTGLAQVNGGYHTSAENKLRFDLAYIANWSPWLDASILFKTIKTVLSRPGS